MGYRLYGPYCLRARVFLVRIKTQLRQFLPEFSTLRYELAAEVSAPARRDQHRPRPGDVGMLFLFLIKLFTMTETKSCRYILGAATP